MAMFKETHFVLQKSKNTQSKRFGAQETCMDLSVTVDIWISELANILPRSVKGEYFAKGTEKCKVLGNLLDNEVQN